MGSRITRALSQTDRQRRPPSQHQARQLIKVMCSCLMAMLVFFVGFLTTHAMEAHRQWFEYLGVGALGAVLLNLGNPQTALAAGWLLVMVQTLVANDHTVLLLIFGASLVYLAVGANMFSYYCDREARNPYSRYLVGCALLLVGGCITKVANCCSHLIKQLRAQAKSVSLEQEHHLGLRVLFCLMGLMIVVLCAMGHLYIRKHKFVPASLREQLKFFSSLKMQTKVELLLAGFSTRSLLMSVRQSRACSGSQPLLELLLIVMAMGIAAYALTHQASRYEQSILQVHSGATCTCLVLYCIAVYCMMPPALAYLFALLVVLLLVTRASSLIANEHRVNYVITLVLTSVAESKKLAYQEDSSTTYNILFNSILVLCCVAAPYIFRALHLKRKYQQLGNQQIQQLDIVS